MIEEGNKIITFITQMSEVFPQIKQNTLSVIFSSVRSVQKNKTKYVIRSL